MALEDPVPLAAHDALERRYRSAAPERILWNDTIARLLDHRTVRGFRPDPLPVELIPTLVAAAQSAATSSNLQLWSVVAVEDEEKRKELARLAGGQKHIEHAPLILLFVADLARAGLIADEAGAPSDGFDYLESFTVATVDAALAAQNAVIAAESLGLGTVYIGALRNHPEEVAKLVGLPPRAAVVFGLVLGWSDATRPAAVKPRLPQSVVLHRETYDLGGQSTAIAEYDRDARAFQEEQGQDPVGWRALVLARGASAAALHGREKLKGALHALGFDLK